MNRPSNASGTHRQGLPLSGFESESFRTRRALASVPSRGRALRNYGLFASMAQESVARMFRRTPQTVKPAETAVDARIGGARPRGARAQGAGICRAPRLGRVRLVIVRDLKTLRVHAVTAVRHDHQWLILDNRTLIMVPGG
jgi:hypothetical protein